MAVMSGSMPCIRRDPPRLLIMTERDNKRDKESGIREESGGAAVCQGHCSSFFLPDRFDNPEVLPTSASGLVQVSCLRRRIPMDERGSEAAAGPMHPCK